MDVSFTNVEIDDYQVEIFVDVLTYKEDENGNLVETDDSHSDSLIFDIEDEKKFNLSLIFDLQ